MSTDTPTNQQPEQKAEEQTPAGSSATAAGTPQQQANETSGSTGDVEMNGSKDKVKSGEDVQDQTEEDLNRIFAARREEEMARRDRSLAEFLVMLDGYKPLVSDPWPPLDVGLPC